MSQVVYRVAQKFLKIEAVGTLGAAHGDPADPLRIDVRVTPWNDLTKIIEEAWSDRQADKKRIWKIQTGLWIFQLDPRFYETGKKYVIHFRYEMTPTNLNVVRQDFVWQPVVEFPRESSNCVIRGILTDITGAPVSGQRLVVETYKDYVTLNNRTGQNTVTTDAFGNWAIELPKDSLARFVFGNISQTVKIPTDVANAQLSSLPAYQLGDIAKDMFGYPFPGLKP